MISTSSSNVKRRIPTDSRCSSLFNKFISGETLFFTYFFCAKVSVSQENNLKLGIFKLSLSKM